jgi:hypothetical protein
MSGAAASQQLGARRAIVQQELRPAGVVGARRGGVDAKHAIERGEQIRPRAGLVAARRRPARTADGSRLTSKASRVLLEVTMPCRQLPSTNQLASAGYVTCRP